MQSINSTDSQNAPSIHVHVEYRAQRSINSTDSQNEPNMHVHAYDSLSAHYRAPSHLHIPPTLPGLSRVNFKQERGPLEQTSGNRTN